MLSKDPRRYTCSYIEHEKLKDRAMLEDRAIEQRTATVIKWLMIVGACVAFVGLLVVWASQCNAQTLGPPNPRKPVWVTNQGGGDKPCVGPMTPNVPYIVVNDNRGAYTLFDWTGTAWGHVDIQDDDQPTTMTETLNKKGKVLSTSISLSPLTNLTIQVYVGDQTTGCDVQNANTNGCLLAGTSHYTMLPGTTMPYPWQVVQINPNGLEFEALVVTVQADRPATCIASHYITEEHSNP